MLEEKEMEKLIEFEHRVNFEDVRKRMTSDDDTYLVLSALSKLVKIDLTKKYSINN